GKHPHANMEIITSIIEGSLKHEDSSGNSSVITKGMIQKTSAGRRIIHSEFNASESDPVHLLQIWSTPDKMDVAPSYQEQHVNWSEGDNKLVLLCAPTTKNLNGVISIQQDCYIYSARLENSKSLAIELQKDRFGYLHLIKGELSLNNAQLNPGDGLQISGESL